MGASFSSVDIFGVVDEPSSSLKQQSMGKTPRGGSETGILSKMNDMKRLSHLLSLVPGFLCCIADVIHSFVIRIPIRGERDCLAH